MNDWNDKVIADFRASGGQVGGPFAGAPLLLLHSTGARSGQPRVSPVMYLATGGGWSVFASYAGMDVDPTLVPQPQGPPGGRDRGLRRVGWDRDGAGAGA